MTLKAGNPDARAVWPLLLTVLLCFTALPALALPGDREQPIYIESDRAERDGRQGITTYEGDVRLRQGSLRIEAERLTVHTDENDEVQRVLAEGSPAHFKQQPEAEEKPVSAEAYRIDYQVEQQVLELTTSALLEQGDATMRGNRIDYDIAKELVKAEGDAETDSPRIRMVLPPKNERPEQD